MTTKNEISKKVLSEPYCKSDVMRCVWLDVLKLFTICEDKKFSEPFQNDEYIFATDKMSIVKVHQDFVGKKYNSENVPNGLSLFPTENNSALILELDKVKTVLVSAKNYFDENFEVGKMTCPDCNGSYYVKFEFKNYLGQKTQIEGECPTCDFTGSVELNINRQTGYKLTEVPKNILKIQNIQFEYDRIKRIAKTAELLGENTIKVIFLNQYKAVFKVGECEISDMTAKLWEDVQYVSSHIA